MVGYCDLLKDGQSYACYTENDMQFDIEAYDGLPFGGAKVALYLGADLAVILRDAKPGLIFADHWDLPGGGREGTETPLDCALRECHEELGLVVPPEAVCWGAKFREGTAAKWFYVARLPQQAVERVIFGDEGQRWELMPERRFLTHPKAVPAFQERLAIWVALRDT
jgi:8-oxo-dGTP diphosphatase